MSRYLVLNKVTGITDAGGSPTELRRGAVVEASSSQISAWGASNFRLMNNPGTPVTTTYPVPGSGTSAMGVNTGSQTHDLAGEASAASN